MVREPRSDGSDEQGAPATRADELGGPRRRKLAEELAGRALVAEIEGNRRTAAELYRRAIRALTDEPRSDGEYPSASDEKRG